MSEDEKAISDLVATWMEASRRGDTEAMLSLMADDVIFMVPGREPFGKEEFAAASRGMTDARIEGAAEIEEIEVVGDFAYLRNRLTVTVTPTGGEPDAEAFGLYAFHPPQGERRTLAADQGCQSACGRRVALTRVERLADGCGCARLRRNQNEVPMAIVVYKVIKHENGWAYQARGTISETFPTHEAALAAARIAAAEQKVPGETVGIEYETEDGVWHRELDPGSDRPRTEVADD